MLNASAERWLCACILAVVVSGCTTPAGPIDLPDSSVEYSIEEYRIGVSDSLAISVWRNADLSMSVPVRPDGKISLPLIGDILAAGKTSEQLAKDISNQLTEYIRSPQVTVIVTNPSSTDFQQTVRVTGAVGAPSSMPYRKGMTVLDVVLAVGGPTDFASANKAKLYRMVAGEVKTYPIYLKDILNKGILDTNYKLVPGDIISVPERAF
jgi:polysaccharide export outer membrane protein